MNRLAFRFVVMALNALCGVSILVKRDGMNCGAGSCRQQRGKCNANPHPKPRLAAAMVGRLAKANAMREQSHTNSENAFSTKVAEIQKDSCEF
jgi:hypothetical protein